METLYCSYHQDKGNSTNHYEILRNKIQYLVIDEKYVNILVVKIIEIAKYNHL